MMSLGTPTGRLRMAGATSDAPPEPPTAMTPPILPCRTHPLDKGARHRCDGGAAVGAEPARSAATVIERDLLRRHVGGRWPAAGRDVDQARAQPARRDDVA